MMKQEKDNEAIFRFSVISHLLHESPQQRIRLIKELSQKSFKDITGKERKISIKTINRWFNNYLKGGFEAIKRKTKSRYW